jgi:hypothetical protein
MISFVTSRPMTVLFGLLFVVMGLGSFWTAFADPGSPDAAGLMAMGTLLLSVAWGTALRMLPDHPERRLKEIQVDGQPGLVFRLSLTSSIALALFSSDLVFLFAALGWNAPFSDGGWLILLICLFCGLAALQGLWGILRRPAIYVTADSVHYRGVDQDARMPWEAVMDVALDFGLRRPWLRIAGLSNAGLVRRRVSKILDKLAVDRVRSADAIDIGTGFLRASDYYVGMLRKFVGVPREERVRLVTTLADEPGDHRAE